MPWEIVILVKGVDKEQNPLYHLVVETMKRIYRQSYWIYPDLVSTGYETEIPNLDAVLHSLGSVEKFNNDIENTELCTKSQH